MNGFTFLKCLKEGPSVSFFVCLLFLFFFFTNLELNQASYPHVLTFSCWEHWLLFFPQVQHFGHSLHQVSFLSFFFFFLPLYTTCGILVARPETESLPTVVEAQSLNHWTRPPGKGFILYVVQFCGLDRGKKSYIHHYIFMQNSFNDWKSVPHCWCWSPCWCCSVMSYSLQPHGLQHIRLPCPLIFPEVCSNSVHWISDSI